MLSLDSPSSFFFVVCFCFVCVRVRKTQAVKHPSLKKRSVEFKSLSPVFMQRGAECEKKVDTNTKNEGLKKAKKNSQCFVLFCLLYVVLAFVYICFKR
jgi:hypothetical protein